MKTQLIFDFDGVLIESGLEVMVTAYNAASASCCTKLSDLPEKFKKLFSEYRPYPKSAGEMLLFAEWCVQANETDILDAEKFSKLLAENKKQLPGKAKLFFDTRASFMQADLSAWVALNKPYEPFFSFVQGLSDILILTYKNKIAVLKILQSYGIDISEERIFSGEHNLSKVENFNQIVALYPADRYVFLDDAVSNLDELREGLSLEQPLELIYAAWGYVNDESIASAKAANYLIFKQQEAIDYLKSQ